MTEQKNTRNHEERPHLELPREMGFQSYERLAGDDEERENQKRLFLAGEVRNPTFDYPHLDERKLAQLIHNLEPVLDKSFEYDDQMLGDIVWNSASYRMAEMYWLLEAKRLNELAARPKSEEFQRSAKRYQEVNEHLYGTPDKETTDMVYGELVAQAHSKDLHPEVQQLYHEIVDGSSIYLGREMLRMPGIGERHMNRLPGDVKEVLGDLEESLVELFPDTKRIVNEYWEQVILPRSDSKPVFIPEDMKVVFERVRDFYDPENEAGITIEINPHSTQLSWDSPSTSVRVGGRRKDIDDPTVMLAKVMHEYGVHGMRTVNGRKTGVPTFDSGMYSEASDDERADYLTFEEGFASLSEMAIDDGFSDWTSTHIKHYLTLSSAYEGNDFRQTYERTWRMFIVMDAKDGEEPTDKALADAQKDAYVACTRAYRGTPAQLSDGPILTFNKDLAYLDGKLDALRYLEEHRGDKDAVKRLFLGKFDPNNRTQNDIVKRYVEDK